MVTVCVGRWIYFVCVFLYVTWAGGMPTMCALRKVVVSRENCLALIMHPSTYNTLGSSRT